ncbi:MAG: prepilin-type N-terminal cleavage/methylation domain-containing protein [Phycisphaeraceae bacterium]|nr:prepilin-type N-terminal cleavage/methylation domain-containing protein [Phycisphaeraceae bacterium]
MSSTGRAPKGFTLVEALTVIGIIAILLGLIMPALATIRRSAQNTQCLSNLRNLWVPITSYQSINNSLLPNADFLPAASASGPIGGLPEVLQRQIDRTSEVWFCPADIDEESVEIGTSYFYLPGLLKYLPPVQLAVAQMLAQHPPGSIPQKDLDRKQRELESRLVGNLIGNDLRRRYPLLIDSQDRHGSGRNPRNGVWIDGSAGELVEFDEEDAD